MAYSSSPKTLENRMELLSHLQNLTPTQSVGWQALDGRPDRLAYKIREALSVARRFPELVPWLSALEPNIRLRVADDFVIADYRKVPSSQVKLVLPETPRFSAVPVFGQPLDEDAEPVFITAEQVISRWLQQGKPARLSWGNVTLLPDERLKLFKALQSQGMIFYYSDEDSMLTLETGSVEDNEGCWTPELQAELDEIIKQQDEGPGFSHVF